jgi:C4-dicarboxylate-specific signal transduction histidine kinase
MAERTEIDRELVNDRLSMQGAIIGGLSSEINESLVCASLILDRAFLKASRLCDARQKDENLAELFKILATAVGRMKLACEASRDFQTLSRLAPDAEGPIDVSAALDRSLVLAAYVVGRRATLLAVYEQNKPVIYGNAARLEQLFFHLFIAASRFFSDEGTVHCRIAVLLSRDEHGDVTIEISDSRNGISPGEALAVFDLLSFDTATEFGRDLSVSKCIVGEMGGRIEFLTCEGEGSAFRVTLPAGDRNPES